MMSKKSSTISCAVMLLCLISAVAIGGRYGLLSGVLAFPSTLVVLLLIAAAVRVPFHLARWRENPVLWQCHSCGGEIRYRDNRHCTQCGAEVPVPTA